MPPVLRRPFCRIRFRALPAACLALSALPAPAPAQTPATSVPPRPSGGTGVTTPERLPLWEVGVVGTVSVLPDYPGSDRNRVRLIPLPYAIYRGKNLRAENGGFRGRYRFTPDAEVDLSFGGALPSSSGGNSARSGMPNLDLLLEVGPRLTLTFARPKTDASAGLAVPVRAVFSTDFRDFDSRGFVLAPEVFYADRHLGSTDWRGRLGIGPVFATERLQDYFYTVAPQYARPDRPAYQARGGYMQTRANLAFARDLSRTLSVFVYGQAASLAGSANEDSPLLRRNFNLSGGVGLAYTFARSTETVPAEE